jgi:hypothetical protein
MFFPTLPLARFFLMFTEIEADTLSVDGSSKENDISAEAAGFVWEETTTAGKG